MNGIKVLAPFAGAIAMPSNPEKKIDMDKVEIKIDNFLTATCTANPMTGGLFKADLTDSERAVATAKYCSLDAYFRACVVCSRLVVEAGEEHLSLKDAFDGCSPFAEKEKKEVLKELSDIGS